MLRYLKICLLVFMLFFAVLIFGSAGDSFLLIEAIFASEEKTVEKASSESSDNLVRPVDFIYKGAFRLPDHAGRPLTFAYGGEAMTFNPQGNPSGSNDGYSGSLFIMGHNRMPYGELPDGNQVAEVTIPTPVISSNLEALNQAEFIQPFSEIAAGFFPTLVEIPRVGMQYLDRPETGPLIHLAWGQHFQNDSDTSVASHAWFNVDLSAPNMQGPWNIGDQSPYSVNDYIFDIPAEWAAQHLDGKMLATGRFRDGGWSGMGPALFAYRPWIDNSGNPAAPNSKLEETVLLLYESSLNNSNIEQCLDGYQHGDEWSGGAWLATNAGRNAVMFAGTKGIGDRYWYGFINPAGPEFACVEEALIGQFTLCRLADGTPCPDESSAVCSDPASGRGWWSSRFASRFIFYDPADLARVASGELEPWQPQPYAYLDIDEHLFHNPSEVDTFTLGTGIQRRYRLGDVAHDRENGLVYVLELFADEAKPVVHVWQIQSDWVNISSATASELVYEAGLLAASFDGLGIWLYDEGWTKLADANAVALATDGDILLASVEGFGVWAYDGGTWNKLTDATAQALAYDNGVLAASFDGHGIWLYDGEWAKISAAPARALAFDNNLLAASIDGFGVWLYDESWANLTTATADALAFKNNRLATSFGGHGIWIYNGGSWTNLTPAAARALDLDNGVLAASFDGSGVWVNEGDWNKITSATANLLALEGETLVASFEGHGVWLYQ